MLFELFFDRVEDFLQFLDADRRFIVGRVPMLEVVETHDEIGVFFDSPSGGAAGMVSVFPARRTRIAPSVTST